MKIKWKDPKFLRTFLVVYPIALVVSIYALLAVILPPEHAGLISFERADRIKELLPAALQIFFPVPGLIAIGHLPNISKAGLGIAYVVIFYALLIVMNVVISCGLGHVCL
jgi:hypothetical protein